MATFFLEYIHHQLENVFQAELRDEETVSATDSAVSHTYSQSDLLLLEDDDDELDEELLDELDELLLLSKYVFFSNDLSYSLSCLFYPLTLVRSPELHGSQVSSLIAQASYLSRSAFSAASFFSYSAFSFSS